jgi:hypothetical protein
MRGAECVDQMYVENIAAVVIMSVMMCEGWEQWELKSLNINSNTNSSSGDGMINEVKRSVATTQGSVQGGARSQSSSLFSQIQSHTQNTQNSQQLNNRQTSQQNNNTQPTEPQQPHLLDLSLCTSSNVSRAQLTSVLHQIRSVVPRTTSGHYTLNKEVHGILNDDCMLNENSSTLQQNNNNGLDCVYFVYVVVFLCCDCEQLIDYICEFCEFVMFNSTI